MKENKMKKASLILALAMSLIGASNAFAQIPLEYHYVGVNEGKKSSQYLKISKKLTAQHFRNEITLEEYLNKRDELDRLLTPTVRVNVTKKNKNLGLILTAYNPVAWEINLEPGVKLKHIYLSGYHEQKISGIFYKGRLPALKIDSCFYESGCVNYVYFATDNSELVYSQEYSDQEQKWVCTEKLDEYKNSENAKHMENLLAIVGTNALGSLQGNELEIGRIRIGELKAGNLLKKKRDDFRCYKNPDGKIVMHGVN